MNKLKTSRKNVGEQVQSLKIERLEKKPLTGLLKIFQDLETFMETEARI